MCQADNMPLREKKDKNKAVKLLALNWITEKHHVDPHPAALCSPLLPSPAAGTPWRVKQGSQTPSSLLWRSLHLCYLGLGGWEWTRADVSPSSQPTVRETRPRANKMEFKFGTRPHLIYFNWLSCDCTSAYNLTVFSQYEKCFCAGRNPSSSQFLYGKKYFLSFHCSAE